MGYSIEDLFGSSEQSGPKIEWAKLPNKGDFIKGKIVDIDPARHRFNFMAKKSEYWLDGKPTPLADSDAQGLRPVTYIVLTIETKEGQKLQVDFDSKLAREALKGAILERGQLEIGDGVGKRNTGKDGRAHTWEVKLFDWQD